MALETVPLVVWLGVGLLFPLSLFLLYSFWTNAFYDVTYDWTIANYREVLSDGLYLNLVWRTLLIGAIVAAATTILAYFTASILIFRVSRRWRIRLLALVMVSVFASYLVRIYAWKTILGPSGIINRTLEGIGLRDEPLNFLLYGKFAVVVTLVHILLPYAILPIFSAMQSVDPDVPRAARDLGAGRASSMMLVTMPLVWRGAGTAFILSFILAAGDYVTPSLVGGRGGIMVGRVVYDQFIYTGNWPFGAALSFVLLCAFAAAIGVFAIGTWLCRRARHVWMRVGAFADAVLPATRGMARLVSVVLLAAVMVFLYVPLVFIAIFSFNEAAIAALPLSGVTLEWYREALGSEEFRSALFTSLKLGALTVGIALPIGLAAAFAIVRRQFVLKRALEAGLLVPLVMPGIMIGVAVLTACTVTGVAPGMVSLIVVHVAFTLPFVVFVMAARLASFDQSVEEAGRDLGCGTVQVLRKITLPLIGPTLLGVAIIVFALSVNEFVITLFVAGSTVTVPILTWGLMRFGIPPTVNAISTVILVGSMIALGVAALTIRGRSRWFAR